jgi:hypothetical protein
MKFTFFIPPVITTILFAGIGIIYLSMAQPHEDAYILFKYANNLANTGVISFSVNGPPVEGATDFLFMILVAGGVKLIGDAVISALIINAIGAGGLIAGYLWLLPNSVFTEKIHVALFSFLLIAMTLTSPMVMASYTGFSVASYCGILVWVFAFVYKKKHLPLVPILGLIAGLWRPDGVIIGVCASVIALFQAIKTDSKLFKAVLLSCFLSFVIGAVYFIWRWNYFGHLLPLPLYVKSVDEELLPHIHKSIKVVYRLIPALLAFFLLPLLSNKYRAVWKGFFIASIPFIIHLLILSFSHQSQNVADRFQGPIYAIGLTILPLSAPLWLNAKSASWVASFHALTIITTAVFYARVSDEVRQFAKSQTYVDQFHPKFSDILKPEDQVILTEAGKLAYLGSAKYHDAVGLNSPQPAKSQIDHKWIDAKKADMIMYDQAGVLRLNQTMSKRNPITKINCDKLALNTRKNGIHNLQKTVIAPIVLTKYLQEKSQHYTCYAILIGGGLNHIYAFRDNWEKQADILDTLRESHHGDQKLSYFQMMHRY